MGGGTGDFLRERELDGGMREKLFEVIVRHEDGAGDSGILPPPFLFFSFFLIPNDTSFLVPFCQIHILSLIQQWAR